MPPQLKPKIFTSKSADQKPATPAMSTEGLEATQNAILLLSPSKIFETRWPVNRLAMQEGMKQLAKLGAWADASLPVKTQGAEAVAVSAPSHAQAQAATQPSESPKPAPPPHYSSRQEAYRPALTDTTVIQALLEYHWKAKTGDQSPPTAGFRPQDLSQINAVPKPVSARSASPAGTTRVFRAPDARIKKP